MGEEALLDLLVAAAGGALLVGPGDDAAAAAFPAGAVVVMSQDAVVEDVDFRRAWAQPHGVGRRALAVALSDLAAMGATPRLCTATVCAPAATQVDDLLALQAGMLEGAATWNCPLAGGDLSDTAGPLVIDVAVVGSAAPGGLLRRDAARAGDAVVITGHLGRAAAGLRLLEHSSGAPVGGEPGAGPGGDAGAPGGGSGRGGQPSALGALRAAGEEWLQTWRAAQLAPEPRLAEGRALAAAGVRCAGDISDGLLVDARRTATAAQVGIELWWDALPLDAPLRVLADPLAQDLALSGGEEFELLATVAPDLLPDLLATWRGAPLTVVGRVREGGGVRLRATEDGTILPLPDERARHFG